MVGNNPRDHEPPKEVSGERHGLLQEYRIAAGRLVRVALLLSAGLHEIRMDQPTSKSRVQFWLVSFLLANALFNLAISHLGAALPSAPTDINWPTQVRVH
jgi:hypothetical protein